MMASDDFSCIKKVTRVVRIALPSVYITNEIAGVSDILESWKRQFVPQLQGIVVSYKNVSLASNSPFFAIEKPFVHYDVKATFELFCPTIGSIVKGKINRISHDYIGCLVHNTINVTIKRSINASVGLFKFMALDRIILLRITCFDFHRKVIHVKGEITEECVNLMKELSPFNSQKDMFQDSQSTLSTSELSEDTSGFDTQIENDDSLFEDPNVLESKYAFQNNNFNVDNSVDQAPSTSQESESSSLVQNTSKRRKKSKKQKIIEKQERETDIDEPMEFNESDDIFKSPKKKKKHKDKKSKNKYPREFVSPTKIATDSEFSKNPIKKKSKKDKYITHNNLLDSTTSGIETADEMKSSHSSKKKYAQNSSRNYELSSSKSHAHVSGSGSKEFLTDTSIKKEILTDCEFRSPSPKKRKIGTNSELCSPLPKKLKKQRDNLMEGKSVSSLTSSNIDDMINVLSAFEPHVEDQSFIPQGSFSYIKDELAQSNEKEKKRKRKSSGKEGLPTKKLKTKDQDVTIKSKDKSSKKNKSKKKDKSNKKSKTKKKDEGSKGRKNKNKNKLLKSKKDKLAYKIKGEKRKKADGESKSKKKKSSKNKKSEVPLSTTCKSEIN